MLVYYRKQHAAGKCTKETAGAQNNRFCAQGIGLWEIAIIVEQINKSKVAAQAASVSASCYLIV